MHTSQRDRRSGPRVPLELVVTVRRGNDLATGCTADLSDGGIGLTTDAELDDGSQVALTWRLRNREYQSMAIVRHHLGRAASLEFVDLPPEAAAAIAGVIDQRLMSWA